MARAEDDGLRHRALDLLGPHGDPDARDALEGAVVALETDVSEWEGSHGTVHGHRVVLLLPPNLVGRVASSLAAQDAITWALSAALSERAGAALFDVRYEAAVAPPSRPGGGPYRSGA